MNVIAQGLQISIIGFLLAFLSMGIFILTMVVLKKAFPYKEESAEGGEDVEKETPVMASQADVEGEVIAAIAFALSTTHSADQSDLGSALNAGRGTWWVVNRMAARQDAGLQRK